MSYDGYIYLRVAEPTPVPDGVHPWEVVDDSEVLLYEIGNYTRNVSGMWSAALEATSADVEDVPRRERDGYVTLSATDGWTCAKAAPTLRAAAAWLAAHREEMLPLNPGNGWGRYEGALDYLQRAADACTRLATVRSDHGRAYLHWSY
jgi:hypothetical protein